MCNLLILRIMKKEAFETWLAQTATLTAAQKRQAIKVIQAEKTGELPAVVQAREAALLAARTCIRCGSKGVVRCGKSAGLVQFRCRAAHCGKTFTALTDTPFAWLRSSRPG